MTDLATYLAGLKAGDVVNVEEFGVPVRMTVEGVTPTSIFSGDYRFLRTATSETWEGGHAIGLANHVYIILPEDLLTHRVRHTMNRMRRNIVSIMDDGGITLTTIPAMRAALDEAEAVLREAGE